MDERFHWMFEWVECVLVCHEIFAFVVKGPKAVGGISLPPTVRDKITPSSLEPLFHVICL